MQAGVRVLCVWLALMLCACAGTNFDWEDAERVEPGMTEAEVVSILGRPYSRAQEGRVTVLTWSYAGAFGGGAGGLVPPGGWPGGGELGGESVVMRARQPATPVRRGGP